MAQAERIGWGVAAAGHVLVFGALSLGLTLAPKPVPPMTQPIDIQIVEDIGLTDKAPDPSSVEPAASVAPDIGPTVEAPLPDPITRPLPKATVASAPKPAPTPAPAPPRPRLALDLSRPSPQPVQAPRGSRLGNDFLKGVTDRPTASNAQTPRAPAGPAVEASLAREVLRQLKPHWRAPTGADAEQLRTTLSIRLARDGAVLDVHVLGTTGVTDSNRGQVRLHQEAAMKAVRLAAPFVLPAELYDAWQVLEPVGFDKRLG